MIYILKHRAQHLPTLGNLPIIDDFPLPFTEWTATALRLCREATNVHRLSPTGPGMYPDHHVTKHGFKSYFSRPRQNTVTVAPV